MNTISTFHVDFTHDFPKIMGTGETDLFVDGFLFLLSFFFLFLSVFFASVSIR